MDSRFDQPPTITSDQPKPDAKMDIHSPPTRTSDQQGQDTEKPSPLANVDLVGSADWEYFLVDADGYP
ncbi:hypothetical protein FRC03_007641 [Tulasnella sp. 419]|nr:hypothetical protein FRC03_007641 [Tulasnella sp. 419]